MPNTPTPPAADNTVSLGRRLANSWEEHRLQFRRAFRQARRNPSEKHIHELRIAVRRLLAHLDLLGTASLPAAVSRARRKLKVLIRTTAATRDAQVQLRLLPRLLRNDNHPERRRCLRQLEARTRHQARKLVKVLKCRPTRLRSVKLQEFLETPGLLWQRRLQAAMRHAFRRALARLECRLSDARNGEANALHHARVALKRVRYMAETARLGAARTRALRQLHTIQSAMGEVHDLDVLLLRLEKLAARHPRTGVWLQAQRAALQHQRVALLRVVPPTPANLAALFSPR